MRAGRMWSWCVNLSRDTVLLTGSSPSSLHHVTLGVGLAQTQHTDQGRGRIFEKGGGGLQAKGGPAFGPNVKQPTSWAKRGGGGVQTPGSGF